MKIACNYYHETEQLLDDKLIDLDYFKYPGLGFQMGIMEDLGAFEHFCYNLTAKRPILLHGLYPAPHNLASPSLQADFDVETTNRLIRMTKTPGLSFHPSLTALPEDIPFRQTLDTIISNAIFVRDKYADMDFVSIENCDNIQWGDLLKPEVITELLEKTKCGFLLDISHAYCASRWLDEPFIDYLHKLPLEKTVEIHINGWITSNNSVMCHTKIHEEAYTALKVVLQHCNPMIITIEYGRHNDRIGSGCPVMSPDRTCEEAKTEIIEQVARITEIIRYTDKQLPKEKVFHKWRF